MGGVASCRRGQRGRVEKVKQGKSRAGWAIAQRGGEEKEREGEQRCGTRGSPAREESGAVGAGFREQEQSRGDRRSGPPPTFRSVSLAERPSAPSLARLWDAARVATNEHEGGATCRGPCAPCHASPPPHPPPCGSAPSGPPRPIPSQQGRACPAGRVSERSHRSRRTPPLPGCDAWPVRGHSVQPAVVNVRPHTPPRAR